MISYCGNLTMQLVGIRRFGVNHDDCLETMSIVTSSVVTDMVESPYYAFLITAMGSVALGIVTLSCRVVTSCCHVTHAA